MHTKLPCQAYYLNIIKCDSMTPSRTCDEQTPWNWKNGLSFGKTKLCKRWFGHSLKRRAEQPLLVITWRFHHNLLEKILFMSMKIQIIRSKPLKIQLHPSYIIAVTKQLHGCYIRMKKTILPQKSYIVIMQSHNFILNFIVVLLLCRHDHVVPHYAC